MNPIMSAGGSPILSKREYNIASATAIKAGQLVKLAEGLVVLCTATETAKILGIAAEYHSGAADALDPRSNGTKIMVWDAPELMFECPAPVITATGGSATTVVTGAGSMAAFDADDFNGGYLKLVSKVTNSTNTDPVGLVKRVTDFADSSGTETFTVASGGAANAGDKYELYPPIGMVQGGLDATITKYDLSSDTTLPIKIVGCDTDRGMLICMPVLHALGVED